MYTVILECSKKVFNKDRLNYTCRIPLVMNYTKFNNDNIIYVKIIRRCTRNNIYTVILKYNNDIFNENRFI